MRTETGPLLNYDHDINNLYSWELFGKQITQLVSPCYTLPSGDQSIVPLSAHVTGSQLLLQVLNAAA